MVSRRPEELCPGGDRASVVAKKRGNARGVKGGRKVETLNERMKGNDTVNVQWTQFGEEQKQVRKTFDPSPESIGCPGNGRQRLNEPESSGDASADLLESNHQLESRIQEIWPSGSEGGAKLTLSLPLSQPRVSTLGNPQNKRFARKGQEMRDQMKLAPIAAQKSEGKIGTCDNWTIGFASALLGRSIWRPFRTRRSWWAIPKG
jgi:hypothetical protein